jgi:hypothetical protein
MMLSSITWPPVPDANVGYKHMMEDVSAEKGYAFSLQRLHKGAWWTGVLVTPSAVPDQQVDVVLRRRGGAVAFDVAEDKCKWTQKGGDWTTLPWPIPATMADEMGLYLDISLRGSPGSLYTSMKASFYELRGLAPNDRYLFVEDDGVAVHYWDDRRRVWGNPVTGAPPIWRMLYTVVPTMSRVARDWDDNKVFCIHNWSEIVPL